eukprot:Awhi_evm1s2814
MILKKVFQTKNMTSNLELTVFFGTPFPIMKNSSVMPNYASHNLVYDVSGLPNSGFSWPCLFILDGTINVIQALIADFGPPELQATGQLKAATFQVLGGLIDYFIQNLSFQTISTITHTIVTTEGSSQHLSITMDMYQVDRLGGQENKAHQQKNTQKPALLVFGAGSKFITARKKSLRSLEPCETSAEDLDKKKKGDFDNFR